MLLTALLTVGLVCGADAPKPKLISQAGGVVKVDPAADPVWNEVTADPIQTILESPAKSRWVVTTAGCKLTTFDDGKRAVFAAGRSGRYLLVVVPESGEPILVAVLVGKVDPPPKPDDPVVPPVPVSDLGKKFQVAFDLDPLPRDKKLPLLAIKVELYKQAAALAASPDAATTGQLLQRVKDAAKSLGADTLVDLRKEISTVLAAHMPTDEPMTAAVRERAAVAFNLIQSALKEVK